MNGLVFLGGGGHALAVADVARTAGIKVKGLLDRIAPDSQLLQACGAPFLGDDTWLDRAEAAQYAYLVAVGQVRISNVRSALFEKITARGFSAIRLVAPSAYVSPSSEVGAGTVVMHRAVVNANSRVGDNCIINTGAIVEHDVVIGNHCHVSTGAVINGSARLGEGSMLGSGAVVLQGVRIAPGVMIGAGSIVTRDIEIPGTYTGIPARKTR